MANVRKRTKKAVIKRTTKTSATKIIEATQKALNTAELLEAILLELPARDLLFARRVKTSSKDAIDSSIKIQRKLFLKPLPDYDDGMVALNPFLLCLLRLNGVDNDNQLEWVGIDGGWLGPDCVKLFGEGDDSVLSEHRLLVADNSLTFFLGKMDEKKLFKLRREDRLYENVPIAVQPVRTSLRDRWNNDIVCAPICTTVGELLDAFE